LGALETLQQIAFEFPAVEKVHAEQLRPELIFRHALPFCITEEAYFGIRESSRDVLAALLSGHTLSLTHLDYHLDGSDPDVNAAATARKVDLAASSAYAVLMAYVTGRIAEQCGCGKLFQEVFEPISGFVVSRMYQDSLERYSGALLQNADARLSDYLNSPNSRLLGSGYWGVMVRGSFASRDSSPPSEVIRVVRALRKLRQVVDEIADFEEDVYAGLVTLPVLFALSSSTKRREITRSIQQLWDSRIGRHSRSESNVAHIRSLVEGAGGFDMAAEYADAMWSAEADLCHRTLGPLGNGFLVLLDLKRAKLKELRSSKWCNKRTDAFLV
jgi:hypothetical protein